MRPDLSVIIPVYNRGALARFTLESVRRATRSLNVETIVIDDGSKTPLAADLAGLDLGPFTIHRQENRGLLFARLAGFARATGEYVLFLDSDDLVQVDKFSLQLAAMRADRADVSYSGEAAVPLDDTWSTAPFQNAVAKGSTRDPVEFFINEQPAPHNPIFRTAYLRPLVDQAWMAPSPLFNSVAEIWFYYLCAVVPSTRIVKVDAPLTLQGVHPGVRLSSYWEKLALGSLAVMLAFARDCPATPATESARRALAARAFLAWRALPHGTPRAFDDRQMAVFDRLPRPPLSVLGGGSFQLLARLLGLRGAAALLRRWQRPSYEKIRTLPPGEFARLAAQLPSL
ncbi:MAG: glycosyltransferase family 2 protein [Verrucomicrobia bacterium]|nr:glycosyltransferase family 2 protein [Verrucomicrobiota bacterium]